MPTKIKTLERRLAKIENLMGVVGLGTTKELHDVMEPFTHSVNTIIFTHADEAPSTQGTWLQVYSGELLGSRLGTVYAWKRTA